MPESIAAFDKVVFCYDRAEVLHGISFALHRGEVVGLLGPNGAGKTTTIKIIAGILAPTAGGVSVTGLPLPERAVDVKQRIGYVPEAAVLFESLTGQGFWNYRGACMAWPKTRCSRGSPAYWRRSISRRIA